MTTYVYDSNKVLHVRAAASMSGMVCCGRSGQGLTTDKFPDGAILCDLCALYMLPEVKVNGYYLPTLARLARALNCPTEDGFAELIWRLSNDAAMPNKLGEDFLRACGYVPFQSFPLVRLKTPDMESANTR